MEKQQKDAEKLVGHKLDDGEKLIFDIMKNDDKYEFFVDKNGFLAAQVIKKD